MEKKIYNAPTTTVVEMETASIIATSPTYSDNGTNGTADLGGEKETAGASSARIGSRQYFDSWSDDEDANF